MLRSGFFAALGEDHEKVRQFLVDIDVEEDRGERLRLRDAFGDALRIHLHLEEHILFPTLLDHLHTREERIPILGAMEDHRLIVYALQGFMEVDPTDELFQGKLHSLERLWHHHVEEEEERLYLSARNQMGFEEFAALRDRLLETRKELEAEASTEPKDPAAR